MTAIATLPVLLQTGNHAGRPAASAVGSGALYNCTTHGLIYQQLAGSWGTWLTLPAAGFADPMTTRGDIIVRNASNVTARLAKGGSGTYLGSDGTDVGYAAVTDAQLSTSDITTNNASTSKHGFLKKLSNAATDYMDGSGNWSVPAGSGGSGALVLLEQHSPSSAASSDFTTFISSTYDSYEFDFQNVIPATNAASFLLRMGTGGGPTWDTGSNYQYADERWSNFGGGTAQASNSATSILLDGQGGGGAGVQNSQPGISGRFRLWNPQGAVYKVMRGEVNQLNTADSNITTASIGGIYKSTTAVTGVQFLFSSGNITSGIIRVYGLTK